jgi:hypothetical protein
MRDEERDLTGRGWRRSPVFALMYVAACSSSSPVTPMAEAGVDSSSDARTSNEGSVHPDGSDSSDGASGARANGSLGAWQTLSPMPLPRANHCAVAAAGYLVVIGGNFEPDGGSGFVDIDAVHVAALHADGSIGAWSQAGTTPSPVSGCTAAASGNTLYLVDGLYDDTSDQGHVFSAELSATGKLGAWKPLGLLANGQDAFYSAAWVASDPGSSLYVIDSSLSSTTVLRASTSPKLGAWSQESWLSGFLGRPEYAFTGAYFYAMGGYLSDDGGNPTITAAQGSPVEPGGKIGPSFVTESLPMPVTYGSGVDVDDWIFVIGGKSSPFGTGEANAWSSEVGPSGHLGTWKAVTSLPQGRTDMAVTLAGDFLYLTGGGYMGPGLATVFAARVRF